MAAAARRPRDFIADVTVRDDGIRPVRQAPPHSRDKLGILSYYIPAFANACKDKAPRFYFVDAFAGEGLYHFSDDDSYALGSTLIALGKARPSFARTVAMELDEEKAAALTTRVVRYSATAVVRVGDCNTDLLRIMDAYIPHTAPLLVLLDPDAFELQWRTIEALAEYRTGRWKTEMLILVATNLVGRAPAGRTGDDGLPANDQVTRSFPPTSRWSEILRSRRDGGLSAQGARRALATEYETGLKELGYATVMSREITRRGKASARDGAGVYHLVFATDNQAGEKIMKAAFDRVYTNLVKVEQRALDRGQGAFEGFFDD